MTLEFTDANFKTSVLESDKLTVVDFWAEWCPPCRAIAPIIKDLSDQYHGKVNIGKLNVDHNPDVSVTYGITAIPVILFVKNGKVVDRQMGAAPKAVIEKKYWHIYKGKHQIKPGIKVQKKALTWKNSKAQIS